MSKGDDRAYREYVSEEQRRQPRGPQLASRVGVEEGCPARKPVLLQQIQATSSTLRRNELRIANPEPRNRQPLGNLERGTGNRYKIVSEFEFPALLVMAEGSFEPTYHQSESRRRVVCMPL